MASFVMKPVAAMVGGGAIMLRLRLGSQAVDLVLKNLISDPSFESGFLASCTELDALLCVGMLLIAFGLLEKLWFCT